MIIEAQPNEGHFSGDDHIKSRKKISILCLPLKYKGIFAGLIYLESRFNHGFNSMTVEFVKRLSFYLIAKQALEKGHDKSGRVFTNDTVNDQLTSREAEVLFYMAAGMSNNEIGEKVHISSGTVKTHTLNMYRKLEVNNRIQAVTKAKTLKLVK